MVDRLTISKQISKGKGVAFMLDFWIGGIIVVLLVVYLIYVLIRPEEF